MEELLTAITGLCFVFGLGMLVGAFVISAIQADDPKPTKGPGILFRGAVSFFVLGFFFSLFLTERIGQ